MGGRRERVLLVGLDMGDAGLVETWARRGFLPALAGVMAEGAWGRARTTAEVLHTSSWPTIFTGALPGRHGVYYPYQPAPGHQQARHIGPGQYGAPPVWQILDGLGKRSIVVDAPETFPVDGFRGVQVFEWATWAWYWRRMAHPAALEAELTRRFGPGPLELEAKRLGLGMPDTRRLFRQLVASAAYKAEMARWLMATAAWDLFVVVFAEPHPAGHYFWPDHAAAPSAAPLAPDDGDTGLERVRDVYTAVDSALGVLLDACDDDVTVVILSGDGVAPNHCAWPLLPAVLARAGFAPRAGQASHTEGGGSRTPLQRGRDLVPPRLRSAISSRLPWRFRDRLVARLQTGNTDWGRSTAFCLPTDLEGCIRINVKGREPEGIVEPGAQFSDVCAELDEVLGALMNPATGKPAVRQVWRIDECFPGERRHHLPDLTVTWNGEADIRELYADRVGLVTAPPVDPRTGTHHPVSFLAARGPRVRPGPIAAGAHIADVAPTILARFGITPPPGMDGRPLAGIAA